MSSLNISGRRIVTMSEVDEMINAVDDGDGLLDYGEFVKLIERHWIKKSYKINQGQKSKTEHMPRVRGCEYTKVVRLEMTVGVCWYLNRISALLLVFRTSQYFLDPFWLILVSPSFKSSGR